MPNVVARQVGDETVLLDMASGAYFGLDPVGARIWELIDQGHTLAEACDVMIEEFDVSRELLEHDAMALIAELVDKQLITTE